MENEKNEKDRKRHQSADSTDSTDSVGNYIPTPPDGGWGWVIVFSSLVCNIIVDGIGYAYGVLLPEFARYFQEPKSKVSLVGSLLVGVYLCAGPIVSGLTNRFGCRPVTIAGSIVACAGFLLGSFSPNINILILTYGVMGGFGFGLIYLPSIVSVGYYFEKKRALATGIAVCGSGIGTFIFSPANSAMLKAFDWKNMLMIHAGIILNAAVCGMLMRPLEPPKRKKKAVREKSMIDRVKEKAIGTRKRNGESESSVAVVETFAKLREAKLEREKKLNEEDSDVSSMPSQYFVKGRLESESHTHKSSFSDRGETPSQPGSPIEIPKIVLPTDFSDQDVHENGNIESPRSDHSSNVPDDNENEVHDESSTKNNFPKGVYVHEVEPLIENGYAKQSSGKAPMISSAARLRIGSQHNVDRKDYARPLYRQDIFYSGSIVHIPQYRSQPDVKSYITSITTIPGELQLPRSSIWDKCTCLPKSTVDTLKEMLDFSLLFEFPFLMLCIGNVLAMSGFYVPFSYIVDHALMLGIEETDAAFLLSVIGITNTIGRILSGILADMTKLDALVINNAALLISAAALFLEPFCTTYELLVVFAAVYGLCVAAYISLTSIILCDLLGLQKLTSAFGILTLARGVAGIYGPPVAGAVYESSGSYDASFYLGGGMFLAGAACHLVLHLPCVGKKKKQIELDIAEDDVDEHAV